MLEKKAQAADYVYLATDPDREGEAISWHLATLLGLDMKERTGSPLTRSPSTACLPVWSTPAPLILTL